jgi:chromosome condensin MukBEF ATPase and DNA-binding subunit MukB
MDELKNLYAKERQTNSTLKADLASANDALNSVNTASNKQRNLIKELEQQLEELQMEFESSEN